MKGFAIGVVALATALVGFGGAYVLDASSSPASLDLHLVSQTSSKITLGWTPQSGFGYRFYRNNVFVSNTWDASRSTVVFSKATTYAVQVVLPGEREDYPPPPTTTTTTTTTQPTTTTTTTQPTTTTTTTTTTTQPPPPGCTQTINSGLQTAIQNAAAGTTLCLASGSYGNIVLSNLSKASDVTVAPIAGATATLGSLNLQNVNHVRFTGSGGQMNVGGLGMDTSGGTSNHLTFDHLTWTSPVTIHQWGSNQAILFDFDILDGLGTGGTEGRLGIVGRSTNSYPAGITISHSHFGGGGCSDGIQTTANGNVGPSGVVIGPGNEFTGIVQGNCSAHADPIQPYASNRTVITGNYFHNNGDGTGGVAEFDGTAPNTQVTNNVFVCSCIYVNQLFAGSAQGWLIEHNVMANGGNIAVVANNGAGAPSGNTLRDNVFVGGGYNVNSGFGSATFTLNGGLPGTGNISGTPVFVGGANPTSYAGFALASNSPGFHAGHDGSSMGIIP